jgi:RNA polymerase sigma-70 factor (ECF subfamily)
MADVDEPGGVPARLMAATAAGVVAGVADGAALDAFLASVERRALRIAEIGTRDRDEALDLVQDAMMNLANHYARRAAHEWPPLFYRILDNRIRDWQRRQSVKHRLFFWRDRPGDGEARDDLLARAPDRTAPVESRLAQHEAMGRLDAALRALPRRQRQAFVLRVWEGLSVEQTAGAMDCSGGSVKTHLSRALAHLRSELDGFWP